MTRGEYLRARSAALSTKMEGVALKAIEGAFEEMRKYHLCCGMYRAYRAERDTVDAELSKLDGSSEQIETDEGGLGDLGEDEPPTTVRVRKPAGNLRLNGSRPSEWGGR
jgi:hypothetical protein